MEAFAALRSVSLVVFAWDESLSRAARSLQNSAA